MRGVVAVGLLLSLLLAGCAVEKKDPNEVDSVEGTDGTGTAAPKGGTSTATGTKSASGTGTKGAGNATGGNGTTALFQANLTASATSGDAPLNVTFTLAANNPRSGTLQWVLAVDDAATHNGTGLPADRPHVFTTAGEHTVVLSVFDGVENATANLTITVTAGAPAGPTEDDWATFNADGTCDAKGETGQGVYLQHRGGSSIWIYAESNDIAGLQLGGSAENAAYTGCLNPDTLIF